MGSLILLWQGLVRRRLEFRLATNARTSVGVLLIVFALIVYPAWSIYAGYYYPNLVTFGLPCPTTIFTIGLFAFTIRPPPAVHSWFLSYGHLSGDKPPFCSVFHKISASL
jgi:hypothetical protein